jgi:deoxyxylulose-5-phosphate synthase
LLKKYALAMPIATIEDAQIQGGLGSIIDEELINLKHHGVIHFGFGLAIVPHGKIPALRTSLELTPEKITEKIISFLKQKKSQVFQ